MRNLKECMDKEQKAILRLQEAAKMSEAYYDAPLLLTDSGGKDSSVVKALAERAGIKYEVCHSHTTADAPETVMFVRAEFARLEEKGVKCTVNYPYYKGQRVTMWSLIPQKGIPPTRIVRYCCAVLKETAGDGRYILTGVRWGESQRRKSSRGIYEDAPMNRKKKVILTNDNDDRRKLFEACMRRKKAVCNPIIDWTDKDVWDYIQTEHISVNHLYQCGYSRVGCVGCPMASIRMRRKEFADYPKYRDAYIRAFDQMLKVRAANGKETDWHTGVDVYHWWMEDGVLPGQMEFEDYLED